MVQTPSRNSPQSAPTQQGPRINDKIRATEVRLIDENGGQVGVISTRDALLRAENVGLDLVEVSPDAKPPVCKLIDYGKYKYQQSKKAHEAKKKQAVVEVKEIAITPNTDTHDLVTKQNHIKRWLKEKNKVKIVVKFRGREISHAELGFRILEELMQPIEELAIRENNPKLENRRLILNIAPRTEVKHGASTPTSGTSKPSSAPST